MNHREPPHPTAGVRRATLCLASLLLPVLAPTGAQASLRKPSAPKPDSTAYLPAIAAPALRFQSPALPREQIARITFLQRTPKPTTEVDPSQAKASDATGRTAKANAANTPDPVVATEPAKAAAPSPARNPQAIIPDDTRPTIHPEEFVPFFQIPGSAKGPGSVNVIVPVPASVPAPAPLPQSSATYRQTP